MTNTELEKIYKANIDQSPIAAMRALYNAGWYEGAGVTPTTTSADKSLSAAKPTAIVRTKHTD